MRQTNEKKKPMSDGLFIAWHPFSRRGQLLSEKFRLRLYLVHSLKRRYFLAPVRYILQAVRTTRILLKERPRLVFVQNPPIFAAMVVYLYARLGRARYVIDSHTGALLSPWWKWSLPIHAFLSRRAITTIVTNEYLRSIVDSWGADTFLIADIPTKFPEGQTVSLDGKFNVAVINTFSPDEPLEAVLEAASALPETHFYVTGNLIRAKKSLLENKPDNVTFTGFLPDAEYFGLLRAARAIMVLTTDDHTMQRGACEAVSLGKPIVTSNWPILREYFNRGTLFVDNSAADIQRAVIKMQQQREKLENEISLLQQERWQEWQHKQAALTKLIKADQTRAGASVEI